MTIDLETKRTQTLTQMMKIFKNCKNLLTKIWWCFKTNKLEEIWNLIDFLEISYGLLEKVNWSSHYWQSKTLLWEYSVKGIREEIFKDLRKGFELMTKNC